MWFDIQWVLPEDVDNIEDSNVDHIAQHGISIDDVEHALENSIGEERDSKTSDRKIQTGFAVDGTLIDVVYEWVDDVTIYPVTAYKIED